MSRIDNDQYVRLYFHFDLKCLIPPNPAPTVQASNRWETSQIAKLEADLQNIMASLGLDLARGEHRCEDAQLRLYVVPFVVTTLHKIRPTQITPVDRACGTFRIRQRSLTKITKEIEVKVRDAITQRAYIVENFQYLYSTCRDFEYEVNLHGHLELEHKISDKEIADAGGSIRDAISYFNSQVVDCCEASDIEVWPLFSEQRRPPGDVFKYELTATRLYLFQENEVSGDFAQMRKYMPYDEVLGLMIDCDDQKLIDRISCTRDEAEYGHLMDLPIDTSIRKLTLEFMDYDGDLYSYSDAIK